MAIEWSLQGSAPVAMADLVNEIQGVAAAIVGASPTALELKNFGHLISDEQAADSRAFFVEISGMIAGQPFKLNLHMLPDRDENERYVTSGEFTCGSVESGRDEGSVAMGVVAAIAWLRLAGGLLEGSGLGRPYGIADVPELTDKFTQSAIPVSERLSWMKEQVWKAGLPRW